MLGRIVLVSALVVVIAARCGLSRANADEPASGPFDYAFAGARAALRANGTPAQPTGAEPATGTGTDSAAGTEGEPGPTIGTGRRAAAIGLAIVPGVIARGLGSAVARRPETSRRLLILGALGVGAATIGGFPLLATYGSGKLIVPGVHLAVGGAGLITASWWSDIWSAAGGDRLGGHARALPELAVELGVTWHHDAYLGERGLLAPAVELRRGRRAARFSGLLAVDGSAFGGRVEGEVRPWSRAPLDGPSAAPARHTGSALAIRAAVQYHAERGQGFSLATGELAVRGRLELGRIDPHLRGSFLELEEGLGLELVTYDAGPLEGSTLLLSRIEWGVYLPAGRGEVSVFYDHRRDHMAGGVLAGPAAGFFGSIGLAAELVAARGWLLRARGEVGSAVLSTIVLRRELR